MSAPTREQFANQVVELIGKKFPLVKISRADQRFSVRINGSVASLENLYRMSILRPDETRHHVERWIVELLRAGEGTPDAHGSFEQMQSRLMPMILPEDGDTSLVAVSQPLVKGLVVAYGLDSDRTISYVTQERLAGWKATQEQVHAAALANLCARSETLNAHAAQDEHGSVYLILFQTMDGFDASRILLPNLHEKLRGHLGSPFAAALPNRDILLCFRNNESTLEKLHPQIQSDFQQMPHQLSDQILLITADGIALRS